MKISVIMVDGGFRENIFGVEYFLKQTFDVNEYETIWVEYYDSPHHALADYPQTKVIKLNRKDKYHPYRCFNRGIAEAKGDLLVIPDADVIVENDFLKKVYDVHQAYEKLVVYGLESC